MLEVKGESLGLRDVRQVVFCDSLKGMKYCRRENRLEILPEDVYIQDDEMGSERNTSSFSERGSNTEWSRWSLDEMASGRLSLVVERDGRA